MKINLPVTDHELFVDAANPIVTKTDSKGVITYANRAFIEISGFSEEELLGQNHNVVRHPDMPPQAFADLWETVKAGQPWRGLVKNRSKSGDFYWVEAFVTPLTEHGEIVGYMSVRSMPSRADVLAAEALYKAVRDKRELLPSTLKSLKSKADPVRWGAAVALLGLLLLIAGSLLPEPSWALRASLVLPGVLAAVGGGLWSLLRMARTHAVLGSGFAALSEGQLGRRLQSKEGGVLGQLVNGLEALRIHQKALVADVVSASGRTHANAQGLKGEMDALAQRSSEQVFGLRQISSNVERISTAVSEVAALAEQGLRDAEATKAVAASGSDTMSAASTAAVRAVAVVEYSRVAMDKLNQSMANIRSMTDQIHGIADQTGLLALNASIEAARAGESGRGFAVVADEVRKLAERTTQATGSIAGIVEEIAAITAEAGSSMDASVNEVGEVTQQIRQSSQNLTELIQTAERAREQARIISDQMGQKAQAVQEVAASLEQLNAIAQHNLETTHAVQCSAEHLALTAGDLTKMTSDFRKWSAA